MKSPGNRGGCMGLVFLLSMFEKISPVLSKLSSLSSTSERIDRIDLLLSGRIPLRENGFSRRTGLLIFSKINGLFCDVAIINQYSSCF